MLLNWIFVYNLKVLQGDYCSELNKMTKHKFVDITFNMHIVVIRT